MGTRQTRQQPIVGTKFGPRWDSQPCIVIPANKKHIVFNQLFLHTFGWSKGDFILILIDKNNKRLGFKKALTDTDKLGAYALHTGGGSKNSRKLLISCQQVGRYFSDVLCVALPAKLNPGEQVIEVNMVPPTTVAE